MKIYGPASIHIAPHPEHALLSPSTHLLTDISIISMLRLLPPQIAIGERNVLATLMVVMAWEVLGC